jgi:hypothetical protein
MRALAFYLRQNETGPAVRDPARSSGRRSGARVEPVEDLPLIHLDHRATPDPGPPYPCSREQATWSDNAQRMAGPSK